jgi:hypothetical protein
MSGLRSRYRSGHRPRPRYSSNHKRKNAASPSAGNVTELVAPSAKMEWVTRCQVDPPIMGICSKTAGTFFAGQEIKTFALDTDRLKLGRGETGGRNTMKFGPDNPPRPLATKSPRYSPVIES